LGRGLRDRGEAEAFRIVIGYLTGHGCCAPFVETEEQRFVGRGD
jgi:hypothetical protein